MEKQYGSIWDWLKANSRPEEQDARRGEREVGHRLDDETLLALEREAEAAARLREGRRRSGELPGGG